MDMNLYNVIKKCYINNRDIHKSEIYVYYVNGSKEKIWTFDPTIQQFDYQEFIGKTKIEAVFYCDRKRLIERGKTFA